MLAAEDFIISLSESKEVLDQVTLNPKKKLNRRLSFTELSKMPLGIYDFGSCMVNNKIYVLGGNSSYIDGTPKALLESSIDFEDFIRRMMRQPNGTFNKYNNKLIIYDIDKNQWETSSLKFRKRAYHNVLAINNDLYNFGGKRLSLNGIKEYLDDKIEVLSIEENAIKIDDTNPHQAVNFASVNYKENIIVFGGSVKEKDNKKKIYTKDVHMLNTTTGLWYKLKDMTLDKEVNGVLIEDTVYLVGGFRTKALKQIESYNLKTGKWKTEGDLFFGISRPALAPYQDTIYIFDNGSIIVYDIKTKVLNEYLINLPLRSSNMYYYNDQLIIIGGYLEDNFSIIPSKKTYSINLNEFKKTRVYQSKNLND